MQTFEDYLKYKDEPLTEAEEAMVDDAVNTFIAEGKTLEDLEAAMLDEGLLGSLLGGLAGATAGKAIGKMLAKVLGVQKGVLYDLLTSRLVATAIGAKIGSRF